MQSEQSLTSTALDLVAEFVQRDNNLPHVGLEVHLLPFALRYAVPNQFKSTLPTKRFVTGYPLDRGNISFGNLEQRGRRIDPWK